MIINNLNFPITVLKETNILNLELLNDELTSKKLETISILGSDDVFLVFSLEDEKFLKSGIFNIDILPSDTYIVSFRFSPQEDKLYIRKITFHFEDEDISISVVGRGYDNVYKKDPIKIVFNKELSKINIDIREDMGESLSGVGFIDDINSKIYWFLPETRLKDNTTYIGRVDKIGTESKDNFKLKKSYEWTFSTGSVNFPFISYRKPQINEENVLPEVQILIEFNEEMNINSIINNIYLYDCNEDLVSGDVLPFGILIGNMSPYNIITPNKKGDIYLNQDSGDLYESLGTNKKAWILNNNIGLRSFIFVPDSQLFENCEYTVFVSNSCRAIRTHELFPLGVFLNKDVLWSFITSWDDVLLIDNEENYLVSNDDFVIQIIE